MLPCKDQIVDLQMGNLYPGFCGIQVQHSFYRIFLYKMSDIKKIINLIVLINLVLISLKLYYIALTYS